MRSRFQLGFPMSQALVFTDPYEVFRQPSNISGFIKQLMLDSRERSPDIIRPFISMFIPCCDIESILDICDHFKQIVAEHICVVALSIELCAHRF